MFDFTKEIKIEPPFSKIYAITRVLLYTFFIIGVFFVLYRILFPIIMLEFSMNTPNSTKNTLVSPRMTQNNEFPEKRLVKANEPFVFNANPIGQFSKAVFGFTLDKKEKSVENISLQIQKSYQAFFYPEGNPIGFKNGSLLTTPEGEYYIVSDGMLRKFVDTIVILQLGYPKSSFANVSSDDLKHNETGSNITDANTYPNDTLFIIDEVFYQLKNKQLYPFVSTRAFLSQFDSSAAIAKNKDFFEQYPVSETYVGFGDGSLVSSADAVFILSEGKSYPVENAETFLAMGYDFNDVIQISQDELGAHQKQKQFTHNNPHPNGTIFFDKSTNKYYIIENRTKRPLTSDSAIKSYKQKPIVADSQTANKQYSCVLKKKPLKSNAYECSIVLNELDKFVGNDFQISTTFPNDAKIKNIMLMFSLRLRVFFAV